MDDIKLALLGSKEAAQRLTDAGVLVPCPGCGGDNVVDWYRHNEVWYQCDDCGWQSKIVYSEGFADTEQTKKAHLFRRVNVRYVDVMSSKKLISARSAALP